MKKIITLGNGFIASHLPYQIFKEKIYSDEQIVNMLNQYKPDVIVNCIGFAGYKNIDDCTQNKEKTINSNTLIPILLAQECEKQSIQFLNISSGCIFNGPSPNQFYDDTIDEVVEYGWEETDIANPASFYARTKASADLVLNDLNAAILRIRMPVSSKYSPRNLITKIIGYSKVVEEPNSITFLNDLVDAVQFIIDKEKTGVYNIVSDRPVLHSELLEEVRRYYPNHSYESITTKQLDGIVSSPRSNCILNNWKIAKEGFNFRETGQNIRDTIREYCNNLPTI